MKTLKYFSIIAMLFISVNFAKAQTISQVQLQVTGLTCSMCSLSTEKSLKTLPFIAAIKSNLNTNTYEISFKPNTSVDLLAIKQKVEKAGFSIGKMVVNAQIKTSALANSTFKLYNNNLKIVNAAKISTENIQFTLVDKGFLSPTEQRKIKSTYHIDAPSSSKGILNVVI